MSSISIASFYRDGTRKIIKRWNYMVVAATGQGEQGRMWTRRGAVDRIHQVCGVFREIYPDSTIVSITSEAPTSAEVNRAEPE